MDHRLFFDINILVDLTTNRADRGEETARFFESCIAAGIPVYVAANSWPLIYYWTERYHRQRGSDSHASANAVLSELFTLFQTVTVDADLIRDALSNTITDLEDAVQYEAAQRCGATILVSGDRKGFGLGSIRVATVRELA